MMQDRDATGLPAVQEQDAGGRTDRRRHWLTRQRLCAYAGALLIIYVLLPCSYVLHESWMHRLSFGNRGRDYVAFWGASRLALQGHAVDAYSLKAMGVVEKSVVPELTGILPWLYPPTFLLLLYPAALLPYEVSAWLFFGLTLAAFTAAVNAILPGRIPTLLALAFPGAVITALSGQNGLLTAAVMGLGMVLLSRRPVWAGVMLGLLCIKPHLAVLIPLALLCSRSWKTLAATATTAAALSAVSVWLFGADTIAAFAHSLGLIQGIVSSGQTLLTRIPTFFSLARQLHLPAAAAYAIQACSACAAIASVIYVWSRPSAHDLRAATLVCATLAASPYLYDYDLTWYGLVVAWYGRFALVHGFRRYEREGLIFLWFAPAMGLFVVRYIDFQFLPLVTLGVLAMLVTRVRDERHAMRAGRSGN
jgi:hypothetical protein